MDGTVTLDRITGLELLELLRAHERYHQAGDVMRAIRDDLVSATSPLTHETRRLREELERAIAQ
jgi:hypothetical protein